MLTAELNALAVDSPRLYLLQGSLFLIHSSLKGMESMLPLSDENLKLLVTQLQRCSSVCHSARPFAKSLGEMEDWMENVTSVTLTLQAIGHLLMNFSLSHNSLVKYLLLGASTDSK